MGGIRRIVGGGILLIFALGLFAIPFGIGLVLGLPFLLVALLLIAWGVLSYTKERTRAPSAPVFSQSATPTPSTCKSCGATNMLGATRCSKCGSAL